MVYRRYPAAALERERETRPSCDLARRPGCPFRRGGGGRAGLTSTVVVQGDELEALVPSGLVGSLRDVRADAIGIAILAYDGVHRFLTVRVLEDGPGRRTARLRDAAQESPESKPSSRMHLYVAAVAVVVQGVVQGELVSTGPAGRE